MCATGKAEADTTSGAEDTWNRDQSLIWRPKWRSEFLPHQEQLFSDGREPSQTRAESDTAKPQRDWTGARREDEPEPVSSLGSMPTNR